MQLQNVHQWNIDLIEAYNVNNLNLRIIAYPIML